MEIALKPLAPEFLTAVCVHCGQPGPRTVTKKGPVHLKCVPPSDKRNEPSR